MAKALQICAVIVLVTLAGCGGVSNTTPTASDRSTSITNTSVTTHTATTVPKASRNPWEKTNVLVAIEAGADMKNKSHLITESLQFWENESVKNGFTISFETIQGTRSADVVVSFVDDIEDCPYHDVSDPTGCAPTFTETGDATQYEQITIRVEKGWDSESTLMILKHELGHTLGATHDQCKTWRFMSKSVETGSILNRSES